MLHDYDNDVICRQFPSGKLLSTNITSLNVGITHTLGSFTFLSRHSGDYGCAYSYEWENDVITIIIIGYRDIFSLNRDKKIN